MRQLHSKMAHTQTKVGSSDFCNPCANSTLKWPTLRQKSDLQIFVIHTPSKIEKVPRGIRRAYSGKLTTSSEKDWSQRVEHMQVPKGRDQVSGGVSVPCRHVKPVANVLSKPLKFRLKVEFGTKSDQ